MDDLQCLLPTCQQRVSDHMDQILDMVTKVRFTVSRLCRLTGSLWWRLLALSCFTVMW